MGLFSSKKIVVVASVAYNMAGEETHRPDFLKSLIVRNILSGTKDSMGTTLNNGYLNGPAMQLRSFFRWCQNPDNYGLVGVPTGRVTNYATVSPALIQAAIPHDPGQEVWVQMALTGPADPAYWAERYIHENYPDEVDTDWTVDFDETNGEFLVIFEDDTSDVFSVTDFNPDADYVYAYYNVTDGNIEGPIVKEPLVNLGEDPFPATTGYNLKEDNFSSSTVSLDTTVDVRTEIHVSYSDSRPDEHDIIDDPTDITSTNVTAVTGTRLWETHTFDGTDNSAMTMTYERILQTQNVSVGSDIDVVPVVTVTEEDIGGGVIATTTTTITTTTETEKLVYDRSYQEETQEIILKSYGSTRLFIYRIGSGNPAIDAAVTSAGDAGEFFPFIPYRLDNRFLSETFRPDAYAQVKKAYKKLTDSKLDKLIDELKENENLGDIDYGYVVLGTSLNTRDISSRKYIYEFFEQLQATQIGGPDHYQTFIDAYNSQSHLMNDWIAYIQEMNRWHDSEWSPPPEPERPVFPQLPMNQLRITANHTGSGNSSPRPINSNYDVRLQWRFINSGSGTGLGKPGAKSGDCWLQYIGTDNLTSTIFVASTGIPAGGIGGKIRLKGLEANIDKFRIYWQRTASTYTYLEVIGAFHKNFIYGGKSADTGPKEALEDAEESTFIVPLHYPTWRAFSLKDASQMATSCIYAVFNCYEIHKQRWYERGIFRILFVIVIAIASVVFTGGAGLGLLGAHLSVGVSLGFTGMTAAIVGAVINAMAALILVTVIERLASSFGILGPIISVIFSILVGGVISGFNSGTLALNWGDLLKVDNLIRMTNAVGSGIAKMLNLNTMALNQEMQDFAKKAEEEAKKIQQAYFDEFGYGAGQIDPMMFVDSTSGPIAESSDTFLTRTLMTGSDIAEMSRELLYEFPELSLKLPDAFT